MDPSQNNNILEALNVDCLYEILLQNCFDIRDLVEIASTCTQLQWIAQQVFCVKFNHTNHCNGMENWPPEQLKDYFRHFGQFCVSFDAQMLTNNSYAVLQLLTIYCKKLVNLRCCSLGAIEFAESKELFSRIVELEYCCGSFEAAHLFDDSSPLQKLTLFNCDAELPERHLSQLFHVKLKSAKLFSKNFASFCQQNQQLLSLELRYISRSEKCLEKLNRTELLMKFKNVPYYLDSLRELSIYPSIENLKNLNKLAIFNSGLPQIYLTLKAVLTSNAPLKIFILRSSFIDAAIVNDLICRLKDIEQIDLFHRGRLQEFNYQYVIQIINNLPHLKDIRLRYCNMKISEMHSILQNSNQLCSAMFVIDEFDYYARKYWNFKAISTLANTQNARVQIVVLTNQPVSDKSDKILKIIRKVAKNACNIFFRLLEFLMNSSVRSSLCKIHALT